MKEVRALELVINRENIGSIKCAKSAGFQEEETRSSVKVFQKTKRMFDKS